MRCHEAAALLAPQLAEGLDAATQRELALHLDGCALCRARLQQEYALDRLIVAAVSRQTPAADELAARIQRRLNGVGEARGWRSFFMQWRWPALAGTAAMAVLVFALALARYASPNSMHLLCQDAVEDHRTEVVLREPRRWQTGSGEILDLARRTFPHAQIPQSVAGMTLQKARVCGLLKVSALHLVYGNGSQQVSVFLMSRRQLPSDSLPPETASQLHQESESGMSVTSFADKELGVVVVGNGNSRHVAEQLVRSL